MFSYVKRLTLKFTDIQESVGMFSHIMLGESRSCKKKNKSRREKELKS